MREGIKPREKKVLGFLDHTPPPFSPRLPRTSLRFARVSTKVEEREGQGTERGEIRQPTQFTVAGAGIVPAPPKSNEKSSFQIALDNKVREGRAPEEKEREERGEEKDK